MEGILHLAILPRMLRNYLKDIDYACPPKDYSGPVYQRRQLA